MASALVELRVLDGPNLYFSHAAVRLTLDLGRIVDAPESQARHLAAQLGLRDVRPGSAGTGFRQRFAARAMARLVRRVAAEAGTVRLDVRARAEPDVHRVVVAYPWRHRSRAEALARAVADVVEALPADDLNTLVARVAAHVREADLGSAPRAVHPRVPVVAVSGPGAADAGRLVAAMGNAAGRRVGLATRSGLQVDGVEVESGDHSGPSGAGRLLARTDVDLAVTVTHHVGVLLAGIGVTHNDVSVVVAVAEEAAAGSSTPAARHDASGRDAAGVLAGPAGADAVAEAEAVVTRITRADGWCVLNGDDPRAWAMRAHTRARPWVFTRDPDAPAVHEALDRDGRASVVIDGWVCVLAPGHDPDPLAPLTHYEADDGSGNRADDRAGSTTPGCVAVLLAAASAGLALGLPREAVAGCLAGPPRSGRLADTVADGLPGNT